MIFSAFKRWFSSTKSTSNRPAQGAESMFIAPAVAPVGAIHPSETDTEADETEAVEGKAVDTDSGVDSSGGESSCGASCGAMFP